MANYHFDIGFDWDSDPKGGYDGYLQVYPIAVSAAGTGSDSDFVHFQDGDTIEFYLFDISKESGAVPALPAASPWISFSAADQSTNSSSPINVSLLTGATLSTPTTGMSTAFGEGLTAWSVNAPDGSLLSVPVANDGRFFFTIELQVSKDGTVKRFGVDPEMIIKP
jgi:hypothetical protein